MKNAGIRVRIERDLRDEFVETCKREGRQASDVLRELSLFWSHNLAALTDWIEATKAG